MNDHTYPVPVQMEEFRIYTTKGCNIACGFCSYAFRSNTAYMDSKPLVWTNPKAIDNLEQMRKDYGVDAYMFSGVEPSLDFIWYDLATRTGVKHIRFNTNGVKWLHGPSLSVFIAHVDELERRGKDFWSYVSYSEASHLKIFQSIAKTNSYFYRKCVVPYIVACRSNLNDCISAAVHMAAMGTREFYWRFEYEVPEGPNYDPARANEIIPREKHAEILRLVAASISAEGEKFILNTAAEHHPFVSPLKELPSELYGVQIVPRFEHSRCTAYEMSLTINFNGDVSGCPKHSYHSDMSKYIVGNVLDYDREKLKARIQTAPKTYCLPVH